MKTSNQLLKECDELKQKLGNSGSPLNNNEVWSLQHQFQVTCGQLLVEFQEVALEKGVERELWNVGFRNNINLLQSEAQSKKKDGSEARDVLNWFLSSASGFYLQLFNQICSFNSLDLVFRRKDSFYGMLGGGLATLPGSSIKKSSAKNALYLCQYCLIHLGDLARYRLHAKQSETFYRHAVTVSATSGHPYNQLALLEAGRGNRLSAVFLYIRSLCVAAPFTGAPSNLAQTLTKILAGRTKNETSPTGEIKMGTLTRMTKEEYVNVFLHFHSCLLLKGEVESAKNDLSRLTSALSTLVATMALTRSSLVHMFTVNIFTLLYFSGRVSLRVGDETANKKDEELFVDPKNCNECLPVLEDLMVGMLAALLLPIHTMKDPEVVITFTALPAVRLMLEWILLEEKLLCPALKKKQQIWPGLCALVNFLQQPLQSYDAKAHEEVPLPEDWDLQGFQPLSKLLAKYRFRESVPHLTPEDYGLLRAYRLTELAQRFSKEDIEGGPLIKKCCESEGDKLKFEAQAHQNPPVEDVLNLERLTLHPPLTEKGSQSGNSNKKKEKVGILKPEGSLERSKEGKDPLGVSSKPLQKGAIAPSNKENHPKKDKRPGGRGGKFSPEEKRLALPCGGTPATSSECLNVPSARPKTRTNVALQAILKRNSTNQEMKQVTFQACSPTTSPNPSDASNESQRSQMSTPPLLSVPNHSAEVKPPSPILNLSLASQIGPTNSQPLFNLSKPPPNVPISLNQPPPPFRWRGGLPPPLHQLSPNAPYVEGKFSSATQPPMEGSQMGIRAVAGLGSNLGLQGKSPVEPTMGRFSNLDLRSQASAAIGSGAASSTNYRIPQSGSLFSTEMKFPKSDSAVPLYGGRFQSPPGGSWERTSSSGGPPHTNPAGGGVGDPLVQSILSSNPPMPHPLQSHQPNLEGHFKELVKYPEQQNPLAHMSQQLKTSPLSNPYQAQMGGQQACFSISHPTDPTGAPSIRTGQRTSPPINSPYHENIQVPIPKSRANATFPTSSNSLFTQTNSSMNDNQAPPSAAHHSSNYFSGMPTTGGGGWWQKDPPPRLPNQDFPQMMSRPPPGRNLAGTSIDSTVRPLMPPQGGIQPQFQKLNLGSGNVSSGLYSTAPSSQSEQGGPHEMADSGVMRGSSTYSLFGPLGGIDSPNQPLPQHLMFSPSQQPLQQNLWSGPSPLERLLEQKKFASGK